jgi:hypothetical protein
LTMDGQRIGSAKKIFLYHNALILHKSKKQTVKDQLNTALHEINPLLTLLLLLYFWYFKIFFHFVRAQGSIGKKPAVPVENGGNPNDFFNKKYVIRIKRL